MSSKLTPLMSQYREIKNSHRDGILFFQVGDFYETFYEDARKVSRILNIALTSRDKKNPVPLAGVPIHAGEAYIDKLLQAGEKVIICDQVENPSEAKGIVKRRVTDIITPGTSLSPATLSEKENNYLVSVFSTGDSHGLSLLDLSTGQFSTMEDTASNIENITAGLRIREALIPEQSPDLRSLVTRNNPSIPIEEISRFEFNESEGRRILHEHFGINDLSCFGMEDKPASIASAGALLLYVKNLRQNNLAHITGIRYIASRDALFLDAETLRNLEIFEPMYGNSDETTLIHQIDRTKTPAGARELRRWLNSPSRVHREIEERLDGIGAFISNTVAIRELRERLHSFPDLERMLSRVTAKKAGPRVLLSMAEAIERIPGIAGICATLDSRLIGEAVRGLLSETSVKNLVENSIDPACPAGFKDGGVIRRGFDSNHDHLIEESENGRKWIATLQETERKRTGIPSLKVGFNKIFGYYIEISRIHEDKVPDDYIGKQTLVSSQRYVTESLKERENSILTSEARRIEIEKEIFSGICDEIASQSSALQNIARSIALLDILSSLADLALEKDYCRPEIDESRDLVITEGRHPVVEAIVESSFIPNDLNLRPDERQVLLITGPNMGGKSTYIRQTALISILAHMGSYVPASRARIGIIDRIFTRVGSSDNLARGKSTFLVEMGETAKILHNCTSRSLVLLDEIGRGTSTADGLSIARAVIEYLLEETSSRPKTLFATHFHELTALSDIYPRIHNLRVDIKEWGNTIIFLHRIVDGKSDRSYGIHVARLAGLPERVVQRAGEILETLELQVSNADRLEHHLQPQRSLFNDSDPIRETIESIDPEKMTPIEALNLVDRLYKIVNKK